MPYLGSWEREKNGKTRANENYKTAHCSVTSIVLAITSLLDLSSIYLARQVTFLFFLSSTKEIDI